MALLLTTRAMVKQASPEPDEAGAESDLLAAVDFARSQGARSAELRALFELHGLRIRQGRERESRPLLAHAYAAISEGLETADLAGAKRLLESAV